MKVTVVFAAATSFLLLASLVSGGALSAAPSASTGAVPKFQTGTNGPDRLLGTRGADDLFGRGGADRIFGNGGPDQITGGAGRDVLSGGAGNDHIHADDGEPDAVFCGPGRDTYFADARDRVAPDCEVNGREALSGGVLATFAVGKERFRVFTDREETVHDLYRLKRGESLANIPNGRILRGAGRANHNAPYGWHLDPRDIEMAEMTIELCDGEPSFVQKNTAEFVDNVGRYCSWGARLVELKNYTGAPVVVPEKPEQPPVVIVPDEGLPRD
ncbi:Hemolysin-type calcium-binding repeat (2 copies) [Rubrobacter radiotolerans]|uniref:Calcium-binding protein n=1 Tax=Rubrobacter radiotolerans TaxID=42256 RepID=A0A023X263_RUBRA|nr:calcium-binding protein [Rubrobacter radiotolerans]AHY46144.1 Hemolysin-type calcium-binding repeat (2 copies) [Rubrobacter radiotolerans]MDX5893554.1 calcium-binding protein [Rubrobacter radiotolerans]SMC03970.1 Hemolysin-type calcium-binding repeat-containing protein [Rubrobacter radiotolerans DSM 5868]